MRRAGATILALLPALVTCLALVIAMLSTVIDAKHALRVAGVRPTLVALIPLLVVAAFASIALHEWGHVLAGQRRGWRPIAIWVGPVRVTWHEGRRPTLALHSWLFAWGGFALTLPRRATPPDQLRRDFIWVLLGGPIATAVCALSGIALGNAIGVDTVVGALAMCIGVISLALLVATALPVPPSIPLHIDLPRAWALAAWRWQGDTTATDLPHLLTLLRLVVASRPPDEWDEPLAVFDHATALPAHDDATVAVFRALRALDAADPDLARQHLVRAREILASVGAADAPGPVRDMLVLVDAVRTAAWDDDIDGARRLLGEASAESAQELALVDAAEALHAGDATRARLALERARVAANDTITAFSHDVLRSTHARLHARLEARDARMATRPSSTSGEPA
ncbi:MAG: M50 family metallopeptidase [Gemmatimonadaceae bacterium]|nr:M50 family metallopeptidase [Gemmatimonadaceae bacterium]